MLYDLKKEEINKLDFDNYYQNIISKSDDEFYEKFL